MASEAFQLAILLSLKDGASGGLDRFAARLRAAGKDGEKFAHDFEKIRSELNRDLAIGGVGVAGLALMGKGVKIAGDFQASMTELRSSFMQVGKDGKVNMAALGGDMLRAEAVAMKLGNALPGTTEDFVQMMQVLKQNGLGIETILNGAADAVGNLAVATNSVPREIAADFAKFGNLFKLRAEDFTPAADVFSRIYSSTGQTSQELVEAARYFQGRAGMSLGIGGLKDAEQMTRIFGLMGQKGMTGTIAGTGLNQFFESYNIHRDKLKDLEKSTGIKLDFFDKKGKFVGMEAVIEQMSQFNKLSAESKSGWMQEIFGTLGMGAGNILANVDAWKKFNAEQDKTISLAQKNAEVSKNFNNQLEALTGSLSNLVVTGFGPLLPSLTSAATSANTVVGSLIEFAKANPGLVQTLGTLALYGTTALVVYGGIKTLTAGFRLMKIAMAFSKGESALSLLTETAAISHTASKNVAGFTSTVKTAQKEVGGLRGSIRSLAGSGVVRIGAQIGVVMAAEAVVVSFIEHIMTGRELSAKVKLNVADMKAQYDELLLSGELFRPPGYKSAGIDASTRPAIETILDGGRLMRKLHPERSSPDDSYFKQLTGANFWEDIVYSSPYGSSATGKKGVAGSTEMIDFNPRVFAKQLQEGGIGQYGRDPNQLAALLRSVNSIQGATIEDVGRITEAIRLALADTYPDNLTKALEILAKERGESPTTTAGPNPFQFSGFPNIRNLGGPGIFPIQPFSLSQPLTPLWMREPKGGPAAVKAPEKTKLVDMPAAKPQPLDLKKLIDLGKPAEMFNALQQPIADTAKLFGDVHKPVTDVGQSLEKIPGPAEKLPGAFNNIFTSASGVSVALDGVALKLGAWAPPQAPGAAPGKLTLFTPPPFATGGHITRTGLAVIHAGETVVPARATPYVGSGGGVTLNYSPTVIVKGGTKADSKEFQAALDDHARHLERMVTRMLANARNTA